MRKSVRLLHLRKSSNLRKSTTLVLAKTVSPCVKNVQKGIMKPTSTASEACVATAIRDFLKSYPLENSDSQFTLIVDESDIRKCIVIIVSH